ncbi:MAG: ImmA/IrrE family metallo-endopeptidase [Chloroflexia bacterium]|nr:ImmA/IrrE family metallo-endopeptidase [Chloroflexia bacterium]
MSRNILQSIDPVIIGERIAEVRRGRGLTQADLAQSLGVARTTITAMENGERRPRAIELAKIAAVLDSSARRFVEPVNTEVSFPVLFRRKMGEHGPALARDIGTFQQLCAWYVVLEMQLGAPLPRRYPPVYDVGETEPNRAADEVATSERNRLGLGDGPLADVWGLLETDIGLRLVEFPMSDASVAGMMLFAESLGGCIAVNAKHPPARQRWTSIHEYAHFLVDRNQAEVTVLRKRSRLPRSERFADAFASSFLMPAPGLIRKFEGLRRVKSDGITPSDVLVLSQHYAVSFDAMMIRLESLNLLPGGTREYLKERGFRPDEGKRLLGLAIEERHDIGPRRYLTLCAQAFQAGSLSEGEVAEHLGLSLVDARDAVQRILSQTDVSLDGEWVQGSLDLTTAMLPAG